MQLTPFLKWLSQQLHGVWERDVEDQYSLLMKIPKATTKMLTLSDACFREAGVKNSIIKGIGIRDRNSNFSYNSCHQCIWPLLWFDD